MDNQNRNIKEGKQPVADDVSDEQNRPDQNSHDQDSDDQIRFEKTSADQNDQIKNSEEGKQRVAYALREASLRHRRRPQREKPFDVFINHCRGTKNTFATSLYLALKGSGIPTFIDAEELELDDSKTVEIEEAIRTASFYITIFSPEYAKNVRCLKELSCMLQTRAMLQNVSTMFPVFYLVERSDLEWVAHGKGCYAHAFSQHKEQGLYSSSVLQEWKMALHKVSKFSGHVINRNSDRGKVLNSIVYYILESLRKVPLEVAKHPVGMDKIVQDCNNNNSSSVAAGPSAHHHGPPYTSAQTSEVNDHPVIGTEPLMGATNQPVGIDEIVQDCSSSVSSSPSAHHRDPARTSPRALEVNGSYGLFLFNHPFIHGFVDLASTFNWPALALVLGSYGLLLSNVLFWMCWSILVIKAVIYNSYKSEESESTARLHTTVPIVLKIGMSFALVIMLLCTQDITERQYTMLLLIAAVIILFEGVMPLFRGTKCQTLKALIPSTLNAMISTTGPIVFGGDLGRLMQKQALWGFTFIFLVDGLAEVFSQLVSDSPIVRSPKTHHVGVVVMLRLIVEGFLSGWMGKVIYQDSYFTFNLAIDDCHKLCRERTKHLLITMVALGGLQAVGALCCLLLHLRDRNHSRDRKLPLYTSS